MVPAPVPLRWVEALVNTRNVDLGTDEIGTPDGLAGWLRERGLLPDGAPVPVGGHQRTLCVREGLRALIAANNQEPDRPLLSGHRSTADGVEPSALIDLARLLPDLPLVLDVSAPSPRLVPAGDDPLDAALETLLAAVAQAVADGTWSRLKACREPSCRWAFYDQSRNRSRAWCSMEICGNRAKARAFRRRR